MNNRFLISSMAVLIMAVTAKSVLAIVPFELSGTVNQLSTDIRQIVVDDTRYELANPLIIDGRQSTLDQLPFTTGSEIGINVRQQELGTLPVIDEIWLLDTQEGS